MATYTEQNCQQFEGLQESAALVIGNAEKLRDWVNGDEQATVVLGGKATPSIRKLVHDIDERESNAAKLVIDAGIANITAIKEAAISSAEALRDETIAAATELRDETIAESTEIKAAQIAEGARLEQALEASEAAFKENLLAESSANFAAFRDETIAQTAENREAARISALQAVAAASEVVAVSGLGLADFEKAGLVKPDGKTLTVWADGTLSAAPLDDAYASCFVAFSAQFVRLSTRLLAIECGMSEPGGSPGGSTGGSSDGMSMQPSGYQLDAGTRVAPVSIVPDGVVPPKGAALAVIVDGEAGSADGGTETGTSVSSALGPSGYPMPDGVRVAPVSIVQDGTEPPEDAAIAMIVANPDESP